MELIIINKTRKVVHEAGLNQVFKRLHKILLSTQLKNKILIQRAELTLVFVGAKTMQNINYNFRHKNKPTDVISFPSESSESLGELIFCLDVLKRQAPRFHQSLDREFLYMLIHGVLHLLGYDHEKSPKAEKEMFQIQDKLFTQLTASKIKLKLIHVD